MNNLRMAGFLISAILMSEPSLASATVPICNEPSPTHSDPVHIFPEFDADTDSPQLNRAWVDVQVLGDYINEDLWREEGHIRKKIDGLSMDSNSKNIVYKSGSSKPVVCATFEKAATFSRSMYHATGHCKFTARKEMSTVDNGFKTKKKSFVIVEMTVE